MAIVDLGAGVFFAIAFAWIAARRDSPMEADLYLGTGVLLVVGALVWGARLGDYNTFHLFFAGIAVFATPAAAVAVWSIWQRLRGAGRVALAIVVLVLCGIQLELGAALSYVQLQAFGPHEYAPIPEEVLTGDQGPAAGRQARLRLPAVRGARALGRAAARRSTRTPAGGSSRCASRPISSASSSVARSPPTSRTRSSSGRRSGRSTRMRTRARRRQSVAAFLKANGIDYIYADTMHPNALVPDALPVITSGAVQVLRLP